MSSPLLAVDTSAERLTLALDDGAKVRRASSAARAQDERLIPCVEALLAKARLKLAELGAVAVSRGPGRFTGIRVGLTFAETLARALGVPVIGVSAFEAAVWAWKGEGLVGAVFHAGKEDVFWQVFMRTEGRAAPAGEPVWSKGAEFAPAWREGAGRASSVFIGPAAAEAARLTGGRADAPSTIGAVDLLAPARARLASGDLGPFAPLYLKPAYYEKQALPKRA